MSVNPEEVSQAIRQLTGKPKEDERVYRGAVTAADESGVVVLPWQKSVTDRRGRIKANRSLGVARPTPIVKRSSAERALDLAQRFVTQLKIKESFLGRPLTLDDFTEEEFRALGLDLWREMGSRLDTRMPDLEFFKTVAGIYLETQGKVDARWTPSGRGFIKPKAERWKNPSSQ